MKYVGGNRSLRTRLIATFLVVGSVPMLLAAFIAHRIASSELQKAAAETAQAVGVSKANAITGYFDREISAVADLAHTVEVEEGVVEFSNAFDGYARHTARPDDIAKLSAYYNGEFGRVYAEKNAGARFASQNYLTRLDEKTLSAQYDFIAANQHPLGEKHRLDVPSRDTPYARVHGRIHPRMRAQLERHGLYDIFLVNSEGRVVYTVFKETDFGVSLTNGPLNDTGLARAFLDSKKLADGKVHVEDYARYLPSYEAPASFASTPIFRRGAYVGSLIVQLPLDSITKIATSRAGLGEQGQTILIGADGKLRADAHRGRDVYNVAKSLAAGSTVNVSTAATELAKEGKSGFLRTHSYDGLEVLAHYQPIQLGDMTWYLTTELSEAEVNAGLNRLTWILAIVAALGALGIGITAWLTGASIAGRLQAIIDRLSQSSGQVSSASRDSAASATQLSEAATQQSASLQETMASIEEISAMVNQNAESAAKARATVEANAQATNDGQKNVTQMLEAIREIKATNDEVLGQMESSNREFGDMVKLINEIGEKTKVINDIVFQTKLLSFNASVEAARAGEHGKGFAVVAQEVGSLANMSGKAAKEISDMLMGSTKKVEEIVRATTARVDQLIEVGKDKIAMGQSTADRCREALERITVNAQSVSQIVAEIASASKEQAQGVQEINKAISQLDQVTQQNSAVAQQSSSQAESLKAESSHLNEAVQTLVGFVAGDGSNSSADAASEKRVAAVERTSSPSIISMAGHAKRRPTPAASNNSMKKAVGADVPNGSDPNFEEF